jgi:hypothetical protein
MEGRVVVKQSAGREDKGPEDERNIKVVREGFFLRESQTHTIFFLKKNNPPN